MLQKLTSWISQFLEYAPPDPLPWSVIGFTAVTALLQIIDHTSYLSVGVGIISIFSIIFLLRHKIFFSNILLFIICGCIIAYVNISIHKEYHFSQTYLEKPLYNQQSIGKITHIKDRGHKTYYHIETINNENKAIPQKARLTLSAESDKLFPDDIIHYKAHYYPLPRPLFKGDYDFSFFARSEGFEAIGKITSVDKVTSPSFSLAHFIYGLRLDIEEVFFEHLSTKNAAIATAMTTGNRTHISKDIDHLWKETGIYHLLSISGLHMTIVSGFIFILCRYCLILCSFIPQKYNIKKIAAIMAITAAYFYMLISGKSVPAMRAFITVAVMLCAVILDKQVISIRNAIIAFYIILLINPAQLFHIGFCLSFSAVLGIIFTAELITLLRHYKYRLHHERLSWAEKIYAFIGINFSASYAGLPLSLYTFGTIISVSFIANIVAVPVVSFVTIPILVTAISLIPFKLSFLITPVFEATIIIIEKWASFLLALDYNITYFKRPAPIHLVLFYSGLYLGTIMKTYGKYLCVLPIGLAIILYILHEPSDLLKLNDNQSIAFIDKEKRLHILSHKRDNKPSDYRHSRLSQFFTIPRERDYFIHYCHDYVTKNRTFETLTRHHIKCAYNRKFKIKNSSNFSLNSYPQ